MLNIATNLERNARLLPHKDAIVFNDTRLSYVALDKAANQVANALVAQGIRAGDRVALSCPNLPYFPIVYFGIIKTGAIVVPLNILLSPREIAYHLQDSGAKAYFCFEGTAELAMGEAGLAGFQDADACEHFFMITADRDAPAAHDVPTLGMLMKMGDTTFQAVDRDADDTVQLLYTSGTTGNPKGAELTQANLALNTQVTQGLTRTTVDDKHLVVLPLFHTFGLTAQMHNVINAGATMVLIPRFDADQVLAAMEKEKITLFAGVPTMFIGLLNCPDAEQKYDLEQIASTLKLAVSGGASLPVEVISAFREKFQVPIIEGYGLTETSPVASFTQLEFEHVPGSVGQPIQGVQIRVVDSQGDDVLPGERGEVVIRGPNVMRGYWQRPDATAAAIRNGWFHTGDIGKMDDAGNLYIVDRVKDMILRGGFNVYPREVEEVLMGHPCVALVAVIGVPHPTHGEEVKAYLVARQGKTIDADEVREWSRNQLASYKYPRLIEVRDTLPMTATGKLLKKELRAEVLAAEAETMAG